MISEELGGDLIDLSNPNWEPNLGSFSTGAREQFKGIMSPKQIGSAEKLVQMWLGTHK